MNIYVIKKEGIQCRALCYFPLFIGTELPLNLLFLTSVTCLYHHVTHLNIFTHISG